VTVFVGVGSLGVDGFGGCALFFGGVLPVAAAAPSTALLFEPGRWVVVPMDWVVLAGGPFMVFPGSFVFVVTSVARCGYAVTESFPWFWIWSRLELPQFLHALGRLARGGASSLLPVDLQNPGLCPILLHLWQGVTWKHFAGGRLWALPASLHGGHPMRLLSVGCCRRLWSVGSCRGRHSSVPRVGGLRW
jgi:hypothetical protein